ncbi:MerR family transcriptional regulator [Sphingomonas piscis]|uniref:MerR family transcriptional regulator n=1 Tax=Sphingomonas piscis TaxID=2714943 RepID=A0A6G7YMM6_9SPHN|nr:MerR family transcriptional regulator [Sphingomonas piscis]QIK77999.1 MerR family transcriptional regulator [Sphingomonas piscis]
MTLTLRQGLISRPRKDEGMSMYTVKQLAKLSGVSVRTLHHYDQMGLLKPAFTGENRYRYYGRAELLRLQDILFHRELGVALADVGKLLEVDGRDRIEMLCEHRAALSQRLERSRLLLTTIDRTIADLQGEETMDDSDLYKGFSPEKQAEYEDWLVSRYGEELRPVIEHSKDGLRNLSKNGLAERLAEGEAAGAALAEEYMRGAVADDPANAPLLQRHHAWIATMWNKECPPEAYAGLADLYLEHPDFRANFDRHAEGFTDWLSEAMKVYAARLQS